MDILEKFYSSDANRFQRASVKFYLISLIAFAVGSPFNLIEYIAKSLWDLVIVDLLSFIIIYTAFFLYLRRTINIKQNSALYIYTLLCNLIISMWLYNKHDVNITGNILLITFMYSVNIALAGFCINRKHAYLTAAMYVVLAGPLLFTARSEYINHYAVFILFLIVAFSYGMVEFIKLLERSFDEELAFKEELHKKDQELADQQIRFVNSELQNKRREVMAKTMFLVESAEKNNDFINKLKVIRGRIRKPEQVLLDEIIRSHQVNHHDKYWKDFETCFVEVHQDFLKKLHELCPELTLAEIRLAGMVHLGLSTKQIADLISNTPGSVDVARSRLRSKLNIPANTNLHTFLNSL